MYSRLIGMYLPGDGSVIQGINFKFKKPVYKRDVIEFKVTVVRLMPAIRVVRVILEAFRFGELVISGDAQCQLMIALNEK